MLTVEPGGVGEHVGGHVSGGAGDESNNSSCDLVLEVTNPEINVLGALAGAGQLLHDEASAVVLVEGSRTSLREAPLLEEATQPDGFLGGRACRDELRLRR